MKKEMINTILALFIFLFVPDLAGAEEVPWNYSNYRAVAEAQFVDNEAFGPPLPVSAYSVYEVTNTLSEATSSSMTIDSFAPNVFGYWPTGGTVEFTGRFVASNPVFRYNYNFTYSFSSAWDSIYYTPDVYSWINIVDLTDQVTLYSQEIHACMPNDDWPYSCTNSGNVSDEINALILLGHEIEVNFGIKKDFYEYMGHSNVSLTFETTTVVPEPISSILFVTGGALLAGRRYLRRKKAALTSSDNQQVWI